MRRQSYIQTDLETGQMLAVAEGCDDAVPVAVYDQHGNAWELYEATNEGGRLVLSIRGPQGWGVK